jgi:hypothetical protein
METLKNYRSNRKVLNMFPEKVREKLTYVNIRMRLRKMLGENLF